MAGDQSGLEHHKSEQPSSAADSPLVAHCSTVACDRRKAFGGTIIAKVMAEVQATGTNELQFRDAQGKDHRAVLSVGHATMAVRPPIGKQRKFWHHELQNIHAEELDPPKGRPPVH
jgi:hypothetical protein